MKYAVEPAHQHGRTSGTAILLCNLGTPDEPTAPAVRRYLAQFLSDPRVVEIPPAAWWPILHGIILRVRPAKSAAKYATIWSDAGSPLRVWTDKQARLLTGYLGERGRRVTVLPGMRYGNPSIPGALDALKAQGADRVLVLPLYPQYSGATTASAFDAVYHWAGRVRNVPELRFVNHYHDHPGYIRALERRVRDHWQREGRAERLVLSFHGMPERTLQLGDPYHCECQKTARLLRDRLQLAADDVMVTFQSRFGRAKWLQPYTEPTLRELAARGLKRVEVMCPGFATDCLETLEEIAQEARDAFLRAGGSAFHYIPCLNDQHEWISALADIAIAHMQGWPAGAEHVGAAELAAQRQRAMQLGAPA